MSIGVGIFLITAGAILAFGIRDRSDVVNLNVVGVVIMLAGGAGIWLSFYITNRRRRVKTQALDPAVEEEYRIVEEASTPYDDAPETGRTEPEPSAARRTRRSRSGAGRRSRTAGRIAHSWPIAVTRRAPANVEPNVDQPAGTPTVRHVDLDPTASGLPSPTPSRAVPTAATPAAPIVPEHQVTPIDSRRRRLLDRFRDQH